MAPIVTQGERRLPWPGPAAEVLWYNSLGLDDASMHSPVSLLTLQFLSWVADRPRTRTDVMEAWRSCPRTSVWEDCIVAGLVHFDQDKNVSLTAQGRAVLDGGKADE
jgi:hypothetical protein